MAQNSKWFENDIQLPLTPSQKKLVEEWLPKFIEARRNHFGVPCIEQSNLNIGAPDLVDLLSFIEKSLATELDLKALKREAKKQLAVRAAAGSLEIKPEHYRDLLRVIDGAI